MKTPANIVRTYRNWCLHESNQPLSYPPRQTIAAGLIHPTAYDY